MSPPIFLNKAIAILSVLLICAFLTNASFILANEKDPNYSPGEKSRAVKESLTLTPKSYEDSREEFEEAVLSGVKEGKTNLKSQTSIIAQTLQEQIMAQVLGPTSDDPSVQAYFGSGAAVLVADLIDGMYDAPAASTDRYVAHVLESAKIIPTAQAQGIGFSSLDPVMTLWSAMRNVAYFFFVIVVLVIGFMIMFRHKINGQTVISVQQAIPNIIVAMIFVTFSYAIGGLLIDAMYLILFFIVGIFGASEGLITQNIFGIGANFVGSSWSTVNQVVRQMINWQSWAGDFVEGLTGITVGVIVALAILFGIIKLFVELLKSYVSIILLIAFSPIILMTGAIPGQNSFGSWIKNLVGNLVAFPVVLLILVTADTIAGSASEAGGFVPPFLLGQGLGRGSAITGLVGLGMMLATPEIIKKAKEAVGAKEGVIGELAGAGLNRLKQGEIAIPFAETAIRAPAAMGHAGIKSFRSGKRGSALWKDMAYGFKEESGDADSPPKYKGGLLRVGRKAFESGEKKRRMLDRLFEGRLFQGEDFETTLTKMYEAQKKNKEVPSRREVEEVDDTP